MNQYLEKANVETKLYHHIVELAGRDRLLSSGSEELFDFGNHYVGYIHIDVIPIGYHQDAPLFLQINFYEHKSEISMHEEDYSGWISRSWIQEEKIHVDVLPCTLSLSRRYAFRYVSIKVIDSSSNYKVKINKITIDTVSSVSEGEFNEITRFETNIINKVSLRTLQQCMQSVFEDGPKRDRRLWLGDLRLQALTNYQSFKNYDLVKKCLYMFAACKNNDGTLPSNVFLTPKLEGDYQVMADYSLLFINTLLEYYENTGDKETLEELFEVVKSQHDIYSKKIHDSTFSQSFCFIDWNLSLDKTCSLYGVYLYSIEALIKIYDILKIDYKVLESELNTIREKTRGMFLNKEIGLFISGKNNQISFASQIWMILGGVVNKEGAKSILSAIVNQKDAEQIVSPYLYNYYVEALIKSGMISEAKTLIDYYWGEMINDGADTFYEIFNPENKEESPYGGKIVHSFCHAWSCTPYYFNKKYLGR